MQDAATKIGFHRPGALRVVCVATYDAWGFELKETPLLSLGGSVGLLISLDAVTREKSVRIDDSVGIIGCAALHPSRLFDLWRLGQTSHPPDGTRNRLENLKAINSLTFFRFGYRQANVTIG